MQEVGDGLLLTALHDHADRSALAGTDGIGIGRRDAVLRAAVVDNDIVIIRRVDREGQLPHLACVDICLIDRIGGLLEIRATIIFIPKTGQPQIIIGAANKATFRKAIEEVLLKE